jgi:MFS family permease
MSRPSSSDTGAPDRGLKHAFRALRHRDFALFWSGALVSNVGTWMQNVTVPFVLYALTDSVAWLGLAAFLQFTPMMMMGALGGVLADRFPRKRILLATQAGQMIVALGLWVLWISERATPGSIVALMVVAGVIAGIQLSAWQSFVPQLVPRESLLNAVTLNSAQFNASRGIGPALAGVVLAVSGPGGAFLINGLSYLFVIGALLAIRSAGPVLERSERRMAGQFRDGVAYVRRHTGLGLAIVMVAFAGVLGAPIVQFTPVFARDVFEVGEAAYGFLAASLGLGAVIGAVLLGGYGDGIRRSRLSTGGLLAYGAAATLMAAAPTYAVGVGALLLMGVAYIVLASALNTSVQLLVAEEFRGRAMALYLMAFTGGYPIGALVQGRIADAVGVQATVAGAGLTLVVVAAVLLSRRDLIGTLDNDEQDRIEPTLSVTPRATQAAAAAAPAAGN